MTNENLLKAIDTISNVVDNETIEYDSLAFLLKNVRALEVKLSKQMRDSARKMKSQC